MAEWARRTSESGRGERRRTRRTGPTGARVLSFRDSSRVSSETMPEKVEDTIPAEGTGDGPLRNLRSYPTSQRAILVIRHGAREAKPPEGHSGPDSWLLTAQGRLDARRFGSRLPAYKHLCLIHSRVARTRETALEIEAGFRASHSDSTVELKGLEPAISLWNFYARDTALLNQWKEKLGDDFCREWVLGHVPTSAIAPADEAVRNFVGRLRSRVEQCPPSSLLIAVSHDVHISTMRDVLFRGSSGEWARVQYLEGILLTWNDPGQIVARWRDEIAPAFLG